MRRLIAVVAEGGPWFVTVLREVWDRGDAVLPVDPRLPAAARARLLSAMAPHEVIGPDGSRTVLDGAVPVLDGDALVVATSGSTGEPKGVIHTHASVAASAHATNAGVGTDPATDRWLCSLPLAHVAGLSVVTRALASGTPLEVHGGFDAAAVTDAAHRGATLTTLVPTALARIDPSIFRRIVVGGTAPPATLPANAVVSYGLTETGSAICYDGRPLEGAEVDVVDGEVLVRGSMVLRAYRGDDPEGRDPRDADGWFHTADGGSWDGDGRLVVHGRRGHMIITGGENVWPHAVEQAVALHPGVAEVAVIGRPDPTWGQRVVAVVVAADPARPPSLDDIRAAVKLRLPAYAAPHEVELRETLPRTPIGKVQYQELHAG